jgi:hypothetical protein
MDKKAVQLSRKSAKNKGTSRDRKRFGEELCNYY